MISLVVPLSPYLFEYAGIILALAVSSALFMPRRKKEAQRPKIHGR